MVPWQWTDDVDSLLRKGPRTKDFCEPLWMCPYKCRIPLTLVAFLRVIGNILFHRGPIESLQQSFMYEGLPPSPLPLRDSHRLRRGSRSRLLWLPYRRGIEAAVLKLLSCITYHLAVSSVQHGT